MSKLVEFCQGFFYFNLQGFVSFITFVLHFCYMFVTLFFPSAKLPPTLLPSSFNSDVISLAVIILFLFVVAIFSATNRGSIKSINTLAGDEAKFAP